MRVACVVCEKVYGRKVHSCDRCGSRDFADLEPDGLVSPSRAVEWNVRPLATRTHWDQVLDGGAIPDTTVLLYGPPGVGKTHEALLFADALTRRHGGRAVVVSAEMPEHQVASYLRKLNANMSGPFGLHYGTDWTRAKKTLSKARVAIVDSLQTFAHSAKESKRLLADLHALRGCVRVLLSRVNASGGAAGGADAPHDVDIVVQVTREAFTVEKHRWVRSRVTPYTVERAPFATPAPLRLVT